MLLSGDFDDVHPGIAAVDKLDGLVLEPHLAFEGALHDACYVLQRDRLLFLSVLVQGVRGGNVVVLQLQGFGDFLERIASSAIVLDLIMEILHFVVGLLRGELIAHLILDLIKRAHDAWLDVGCAQQNNCEPTLNNVGNGVFFKCKSRVCDLGIN